MPDNQDSQDDQDGTVDGGVDLAAYAAYRGASEAAAAVLEHLRAQMGFRFWAVTRVTGQTYAVVDTGSTGFPAAAGRQIPWDDTLCWQVLAGRAPRVVPDVRALPAYRHLPLVEQWQVGAYLSVPLSLDGRSLYGTVCAVDPLAQPAAVSAGLDLVERQARLLSTLLAAELRADEELGRAERAEAAAEVDPLTGLVNRRGWDLLLEREEQRCRRYGAVAGVLMIDLDGLKTVNDRHGHAAGDALLRNAADVLRGAVRSADIVARLGGDEFAVLTIETDLAAARAERDRLHQLLAVAGVPASLGAAARDPDDGLAAACLRADADMYRAKQTGPGPQR